MSAFLRYTFMLLVAGFITGCGFHLRSAPTLPDNVNTVVIDSARAHAPLAKALNERLNVYGLSKTGSSVSDRNQSVNIYLLPENLERRLLSVYASGQVAEYELIYIVRYRVLFPDSDPIVAQFEVVRDYQDDPDQVLAKSRELELVLDEMRTEAADILIRRLSSQAASLALKN